MHTKYNTCLKSKYCFMFCSIMMLLSSVSGTWLKSLPAFFFYIVKSVNNM